MTKKKRIEWRQQCESCDATGIYCGMAERDGFGVVCAKCNGTGFVDMKIRYKVFDQRRKLKDVHTVLEFNPGIMLGGEYDFGGQPYKDWLNGKSFPEKSEMRNYTCPAWWYQTADYRRKPNWDECIGIGSFSKCKHFARKDKCWERFDRGNC